MDFPFVLPYNKRNYSPQGKRRTTMLYPIMNRSRSLIDLGGIWHFKLGDETEPEDTWSAPQEMDLIAVPASYNDQKDDPSYRNHYGGLLRTNHGTSGTFVRKQRTASGTAF